MQTTLNDLTILFLSILLEALPFVLLGSVIASVISLFVSDELMYRFIPKNRFGGLVVVSLLGILFPVCDCTIIPIMRRLIRKGLRPSLAVTFMCAVPIVNPAVIASTSWAFTNQPHIIWLRLFVGMWTAITAGFIVGKVTGDINPLLDTGNTNPISNDSCCSCGHEHASDKLVENEHAAHESTDAGHESNQCGCGHDHHPTEKKSNVWRNILEKTQGILTHTTNEFIDSASLIVIGAFLSAIVQILVPRTIMYPLSSSPVASVGAMMGFTWLISLCSNADAFVAKSFYGLFTTGSVVAFMTFGQMIDLKNTIVMLGFFKKRFVVMVLGIIAVLSLIWGVAINLAVRGL